LRRTGEASAALLQETHVKLIGTIRGVGLLVCGESVVPARYSLDVFERANGDREATGALTSQTSLIAAIHAGTEGRLILADGEPVSLTVTRFEFPDPAEVRAEGRFEQLGHRDRGL
jgi:hypothetical protein